MSRGTEGFYTRLINNLLTPSAIVDILHATSNSTEKGYRKVEPTKERERAKFISFPIVKVG